MDSYSRNLLLTIKILERRIIMGALIGIGLGLAALNIISGARKIKKYR